MKKYTLALLALLMSVAFILVMSEFEFKPLDALMKPPMVEGENQEIQLAFEEIAGRNYRLIAPLKGNHRSAYTFFNLNGDSTDEVIVFYSKKEDKDIVRMNILGENSDGKWVSLADIETGHSDVQKIEFADLNGDKIKELIVGWTVFRNEYAKSMHVYSITENAGTYSFENIYSSPYYDFELIDVNCDAVKDILKIDYVKAMDRAEYKAVLLNCNDNAVSEVSSVKLDLSFSSVTSVTSEYIESKNLRRIYIDGIKHESGTMTDCIYFDSKTGHLKKERGGFPPVSVWSSRISNIASADINDDGLIEIPVEEEIVLSEVISENTSQQNKQFMIKWRQLDKSRYDVIYSEILNPVYGYSYKIDNDFQNHFTITNNIDDGILTFYALDYTGGKFKKGEKLFSIYAIASADADDFNDYRYKFLKENHRFSYYCIIYDAGENSGISKSEIRKNIILN